MRPEWLYNADQVDALQPHCLRGRSNQVARDLADAQLLLRCKRDGRFIAVLRRRRDSGYALHPLPALEPAQFVGVSQLLACLGLKPCAPLHARRPTALRHLPRHHTALPAVDSALASLLDALAALGIDAWAYAQRTGLPLMPEPPRLLRAGTDRYGRPLWLLPGCRDAWLRMRHAARDDGIRIEAVSGFRGFDYQRGIIERKRRRGQSMQQILAVNAAPGFSEHHTGRALDIGTPGEPPAEESFERTQAFAWLCRRAGEFGFRLSYPRENPHGIAYEPWHWFWTG